jgi:hypothetical protein
MRARWLVLALALAACEEGLFIEVHRPADVTADRVQLLIADRPCELDGERCTTMQPEGVRTLEGEVYFRDAVYESIAELDDDGVAVFQLGRTDLTLPLVIAVGLVDGQPTSVAVMKQTIDLSRHAAVYRVELEPAVPLGSTQPGTRAVVEGARDARTLECLGVDGPEGPLFVVPADDPDCDGVAPPECDPLAYLGASITDHHCTTKNGDLGGACTAGHEVCREDPSSNAPACTTERYCVPDALCGNGCGRDEACHAATLATLERPRLHCKLPGQDVDQLGRIRPCNDAPPVVLALPIDCVRPPRFVDLGPPAPAAVFDAGESQLQLDDVTFRVDEFSANPGCTIELEWNGELTTGSNRLAFPLAIDLAFTINGEGRRVLFPATFEITQSCDATVVGCQFEDVNDAVIACTLP